MRSNRFTSEQVIHALRHAEVGHFDELTRKVREAGNRRAAPNRTTVPDSGS